MYVTFKEHFKIPAAQPVDFLDIPIDDNELLYFIDPFLIANNKSSSKILDEIYLQLTSFFTKLNGTYIVPKDRINGLPFLSKLHEPNEYHLGYSETNKGKAIAGTRAETIFEALSNNVFASKAGITITNDAHNVLLLVEGIGQDIMSDVISNVCRNVFAKFTLKQCAKYRIPTSPVQLHYYNPLIKKWENQFFDLPSYLGKPIILVPKKILSSLRDYTHHYNYFMAGHYIAKDILNGKLKVTEEGKFIKTKKDGEKKPIVKSIYKAYRKPKRELVDFAKKHGDSLLAFLDYAKLHYPGLDLSDFDE